MNETFGQESGAGERSLRSLRRALKRKRSSIPLFLRANTQRAYEGAVDRFSAWLRSSTSEQGAGGQ